MGIITSKKGEEKVIFSSRLWRHQVCWGGRGVGRQGEKDEGGVCCPEKQLDFQAAWKT